MTAAIAAPAWAHPFGDLSVAQRLEVEIAADAVRVGLVVDAPAEAIAADSAAASVGWAEALRAGVTVTIDGVSAPLRVVHAADRLDLVGMHTSTYELILVADADLRGAHTLEVTNGNLASRGGWYLADLRVPASAVLRSTSLVVTPRLGKTSVLAGAWTRSELRRRVRAEVALPDTPWARVCDAALPPLGPAAAVGAEPSPHTATAAGRRALGALLTGAAAGASVTGPGAWALTAGAVVAGAAGLSGAPPWLVVGITLAAAATRLGRFGGALAVLAVAAASPPAVVALISPALVIGLVAGAAAPASLRGPGLRWLALALALAGSAG